MADKSHVRELAGILSKLQGKRWEGAIITRAKWRRRDNAEASKLPEVLANRHGMVKIRCRGFGEELMVMLLCHHAISTADKILAANREAEQGEELFFPVETIRQYTAEVQDTNYLHQGDNPVVPGLLILERMLESCPAAVQNISLRFSCAAYAGRMLVDWEQGKLYQQGRCTADFQWQQMEG